jgi:hypothetical protein
MSDMASDYDYGDLPEPNISDDMIDKLKEVRRIQKEKSYREGWIFYELCKFYPKKTASALCRLQSYKGEKL